MSRATLEHLLKKHGACFVAKEAFATSRHRDRYVQGFGHEVQVIPPIYLKPFVKRQNSDAADAAVIAETDVRPNRHYVTVKSAEHQARAVASRP